MTDEEIKALLPEVAPKALEKWAVENLSDELGGERILFHRASVIIEPEMKRTMSPADWKEREKNTKRKWGAECSCLSCGETFTAGWCSATGRREKGIVLRYGEDGIPYEGYEDENANDNGDGWITQFGEGERVTCPLCMTEGKLTAETSVYRGRTFSILVMEARNIEGLTTLLYWRVCRRLDSFGYRVWTEPFEALVLDGKRLRRYSHSATGMYSGVAVYDEWRARKSFDDPAQRRYHDADSYSYKKVGAAEYPYVPDMEGCSGEKTGLREYLAGGKGGHAALYLKLWTKHPQIENIMKAGWAYAVQTQISDEASRALGSAGRTDRVDIPWLNFREVKPHRMLGVSRQELREGAKLKWRGERVYAWRKYSVCAERCEPTQYAKWLKAIGTAGVDRLADMAEQAEYRDMKLTASLPYMKKQEQSLGRENAIDFYCDYRRMLYTLRGEAATEEERWPRDLRAAHDRLTEIQKRERAHTYQEGFDDIRKRWSGLEWNDGELCTVLPKCAGDLTEEGNTLRHCVGGYAAQHKDGKLIIFVRHYRRPERSYYTLNIDITGTAPKQIQLHGYGNERHGKNKEHAHSIPKKVLEFVETWKRDVLTPVFQDVTRKEAAEKSRKTKNRKEKAA